MKARDILIALHIKCNGDWDDIFYHLRNKTDLNWEELLDGVDTSKCITLLDEDYPPHLKYLYRPEFVICK